ARQPRPVLCPGALSSVVGYRAKAPRPPNAGGRGGLRGVILEPRHARSPQNWGAGGAFARSPRPITFKISPSSEGVLCLPLPGVLIERDRRGRHRTMPCPSAPPDP